MKNNNRNSSYGFPKDLLEVFRTLVPRDIKDGIRDDAYNVSRKIFRDALSLDKISYI